MALLASHQILSSPDWVDYNSISEGVGASHGALLTVLIRTLLKHHWLLHIEATEEPNASIRSSLVMIAELVAFNAAFGVVKQFISNGKDLHDCFGQIGQMVNAKEDLKARQQKNKKSLFSK
jgi:hypothetical protein